MNISAFDFALYTVPIQFLCLQNLLFHLRCGKCLKCETMHNGNDKHDNRWECARSVLVFTEHSLGEKERYTEKKNWKTYTLIKLFKMTVVLWYCCHKTCAQCNQNRTKIYDIASWNGTKHSSNFRETITWHAHSDVQFSNKNFSKALPNRTAAALMQHFSFPCFRWKWIVE